MVIPQFDRELARERERELLERAARVALVRRASPAPAAPAVARALAAGLRRAADHLDAEAAAANGVLAPRRPC